MSSVTAMCDDIYTHFEGGLQIMHDAAIETLIVMRDDIQTRLRAVNDMAAELAPKLRALNAAISVLTSAAGEPAPSFASQQQEEPPKQSKPSRQRTKSTSFDMSGIPDFNPGGGGIRTDI